MCQLPVLVADRPLFAKRLGYLRSRLTVPKPSSLQRAPAGQGSFVLPWLAEALQQLRAPWLAKILLGLGLCGRLPRHGVGGFLFV